MTNDAFWLTKNGQLDCSWRYFLGKVEFRLVLTIVIEHGHGPYTRTTS